jgi:basic amino acid/polyamine antiporter, APA family
MQKKVSFNTAIAIVVANMIGTGIFTSLGYQAFGTPAIFPLLFLWLVGGIVALCGSLSYGELAGMMPRSGGEYHYLSQTYHPAFGFLSGWASAIVAFSAPVAAASIALGKYSASVADSPDNQYLIKGIAITVILLVTLIHSTDVNLGSIFQRYSTVVKVLLIGGFILGGFFITSKPIPISLLPQQGDWNIVFSQAFAVNLAFVSFAYSGWNASAYLANEIENPQRNVPISLFLGTLGVMLIYMLMNFVFLYTVPVETYAAEQAKDFSTPLEVGYLSGNMIFGTVGGKIMGSLIALLLVSSISAMIFAGPRVSQVMGEDHKSLRFFAFQNKKGIPSYAILLQSVLSIIVVLTAAFDQIILGISFMLDIFTFSTVLGVIVLRITQPKTHRPYKTFLFPLTPLIFLAATGWTMFYLFHNNMTACLISLGIVLLGLVVYVLDKALFAKK